MPDSRMQGYHAPYIPGKSACIMTEIHLLSVNSEELCDVLGQFSRSLALLHSRAISAQIVSK